MQKLNIFGQELMNYKKELSNKEYPKIVHDSLVLAVDKLLADKFIEDIVHTSLKDNTSLNDFEKILLETKNCRKSQAELEKEYEELKNQFISNIYADITLIPNDISFEFQLDEEKFLIKKDFLITDEFLKNYFYIPTEEEFEALIKRKGFIEKFAILRLEKVFNDFLEKNQDIKEYNISHTNVFYNSETNNYGIQLDIEIEIEDMENEEKRVEIAKSVATVLAKADEHYNIKMFG